MEEQTFPIIISEIDEGHRIDDITAYGSYQEQLINYNNFSSEEDLDI